jgi:hypothetical protein
MTQPMPTQQLLLSLCVALSAVGLSSRRSSAVALSSRHHCSKSTETYLGLQSWQLS